jgi:hypothetical protein
MSKHARVEVSDTERRLVLHGVVLAAGVADTGLVVRFRDGVVCRHGFIFVLVVGLPDLVCCLHLLVDGVGVVDAPLVAEVVGVLHDVGADDTVGDRKRKKSMALGENA